MILRQFMKNIITQCAPLILLLNIILRSDVIYPINIGFWSSWKIPCGIAMHTEHLYNALKKKDWNVFVFEHVLTCDEVIKRALDNQLDIIHIQYDVDIFPPVKQFIAALKELRKSKIRIVLTIHAETHHTRYIIPYSDVCIFHKPPHESYAFHQRKITVLPMGIPVFNVESSLLDVRRKYNFETSDTIVTTIGLLLPHKEFSRIVEIFAPHLLANHKVKLQMIIPTPLRYSQSSNVEYEKLKSVISKYALENQTVLITNFIPQQELSERIWISDVGYQWFNHNTPSTSAAAKEYFSAQVPLVLNDSSHFHDNTIGVYKTPSNPDQFVAAIINLLSNGQLKAQMREQLKNHYLLFNFDTLIKRYESLYYGVLDGSKTEREL